MAVEPSGGPHYSSHMEARVAVLEEIATATKTALIDIRAEMREMRNELRADYRWLMGLMLAATGGILAVMAHGFHWF